MPPLPGPVKNSHKKDDHKRWPHRFRVSWSPPTRPLDLLIFEENKQNFDKTVTSLILYKSNGSRAKLWLSAHIYMFKIRSMKGYLHNSLCRFKTI